MSISFISTNAKIFLILNHKMWVGVYFKLKIVFIINAQIKFASLIDF